MSKIALSYLLALFFACASLGYFQLSFADLLISPPKHNRLDVNETRLPRGHKPLTFEQNGRMVCDNLKKEYFRYLHNRGVARDATERKIADKGIKNTKIEMEFKCDTYIRNRPPYTRAASQTDPDDTLHRYNYTKE
jgi:hypothetical protein